MHAKTIFCFQETTAKPFMNSKKNFRNNYLLMVLNNSVSLVLNKNIQFSWLYTTINRQKSKFVKANYFFNCSF